jgi:uncharacterized protein YegL
MSERLIKRSGEEIDETKRQAEFSKGVGFKVPFTQTRIEIARKLKERRNRVEEKLGGDTKDGVKAKFQGMWDFNLGEKLGKYRMMKKKMVPVDASSGGAESDERGGEVGEGGAGGDEKAERHEDEKSEKGEEAPGEEEPASKVPKEPEPEPEPTPPSEPEKPEEYIPEPPPPPRIETEYEKVLKEVSPHLQRLRQKMQEIFEKRQKIKWDPAARFGRRIDIRKQIKAEVSGVDPRKPFLRREIPQRNDYAIEILVDLSGSMNGAKITETHKAVVAVCEALKNIGVKVSLRGFNLKMHEFKSFEDRYDDVKETTMKMLKIVSDTKEGNGGNDDAVMVKSVADKLAIRKEKRKIMFVLSDGLPANVLGKTPDDLKQELKDVVRKIEKDGQVQIFGFGIGPGTDHVKGFYKNSVVGGKLETFLPSLIKKLVDEIDKDSPTD